MKTLKRLTILAAVVITISAFALNVENERKTFLSYTIGDVVEDFELKNVDGTLVSMNSFANVKGFIIAFTCNHCPYSVAYEKRIAALNDNYKETYPIIAINSNNPKSYPADSFENMQKRYLARGWTFPYLIDNEQKTCSRFGAKKTPEIFVVQRTASGYILRYTGAIDNNYKSPEMVTKFYVEDAVNALLKGEPIVKPVTKAIGCSIKS